MKITKQHNSASPSRRSGAWLFGNLGLTRQFLVDARSQQPRITDPVGNAMGCFECPAYAAGSYSSLNRIGESDTA